MRVHEIEIPEGRVELRIPDDPWWYTAEIGALEVKEEHRGKGWGRTLVKMALDKAKRRGVVNVVAAIYAYNEVSVALFRKMGFVDCGEMPVLSRRSGRMVRVMENRLCETDTDRHGQTRTDTEGALVE